MDDEDKKLRSQYLQSMVGSPGGKALIEHLREEIRDGWDEFILLPVEKKTSKAAFSAQARYKANKDLLEWIDSEIKVGQ